MVAPIAPAPGDLRAILINNNAEKTGSPNVDLILSAQGALEMLIANAADFAGAVWETYVTAKEWTLADEEVGPGFGDGDKTVYAKFRDLELNESDVHSATIELDTAPPVVGAVPVIINDGSLRTGSRQVTLTLNATGATSVEIFNEDELDTFTEGTIIPFSTTVSWTLSEGNGAKEVLVAFIDDIGNRSSFFSDTVSLIGQSSGLPVITEPANGIAEHHFIDVRGTGDPESTVRIEIGQEE